MTRQEKEARNLIIAERRLSNESINDIAKEFGLSVPTVSEICKRLGLAGRRSNKKAAYRPKKKETLERLFVQEEARRADVVRTRLVGYEYIGNYTGSDGTADIQCVECGAVRTVSWISIRHKHVGICPTCEEKRKEAERAEIKRQKIKAREESDAKKKALEAEREAARSYVHICPVCGKQFTGTRQRVNCSPECGRKRNNIRSSKRKDKRFGHRPCISWQDIRLATGNMTCALCGGQCDEEDKVVYPDGTIVCGDNYPSVDHIVPAALGGTDTWDNVQLAHRGCNTLKSSHSSIVFFTDQAVFNL